MTQRQATILVVASFISVAVLMLLHAEAQIWERHRFPVVHGAARTHLTSGPEAHVTAVTLYADHPDHPVAVGTRTEPVGPEKLLGLLPWNIYWDSRFLTNGVHVLVVRAYSGDKLVAEESTTVDVENSNVQAQ